MEPSRAPELLPDEGGEWTEADVEWLRARRGSGVHRVLTARDIDPDERRVGAGGASEPPMSERADAASAEDSTRSTSARSPSSSAPPPSYARWRAHGARVLLGISHNPYKPTR